MLISKTASNLQRISTTGKVIGLCVNAMPQNLAEIYEIVRRTRDDFQITVRSLMIQRIIPSGNASGKFKFGLNLDDVDILMRQIDRIATEFGTPIQFEDPVPWCTVSPMYHKYLARCEWGYTRGAVSSEGFLNRCAADDHYRLGTIFDRNVQDIWESHPTLQSFRSKKYLPVECQECADLSRCGGGCSLSCGTLRDHDIDKLFIQRMQHAKNGQFTPSAPSGEGYDRSSIRFAYEGDLEQITELETTIFGDSFPVFHPKNIYNYFQRCSKAFRVAVQGSKVIGYSIVFPLNQQGVNEVTDSTPESVVKMNPLGINDRFSNSDRALYIEVIAVKPDAPMAARIGLVKDLLLQLKKSDIPAYTCPITDVGVSMAHQLSFVEMPLQHGDCRILMSRQPESKVKSKLSAVSN